MLNNKQLEKIENRIKEIDQFLNDNRDYSKFDSNALFNERAEQKAKAVLQGILQGYYSDPPGWNWYVPKKDKNDNDIKDEDGLMIY